MYRCCCGLPFFESRFHAPESPPHPHHHRPRELHEQQHHHHDRHHRPRELHEHHHHHDDHHQHHGHHRDRELDLNFAVPAPVVEDVSEVVVEEVPVVEEKAPAPPVVVEEEVPIPRPVVEEYCEEPVKEEAPAPTVVVEEEVPVPVVEEYCEEPVKEADPNAAVKALAWEAEGFGRHARGGFDGSIYVVTSLEDDEDVHGTLRHASSKKEPLWIVFAVSGTISLRSSLKIGSHKTIDGRGQKVTISGKGGFKLKECQHVIICNLIFEAGSGDDADAIQIKPESQHIWVDRCTLSDYDDGLIDITRASTDITVSRCRLVNHDKAFLIGADKSHVDDRCIRVTIHHCVFDDNKQYQPRVRFAKVHLYNNYTRSWGSYAVCAGVESQIFSQSCIYEAGEKNKKKAFKYDSEKASDRDESASGSVRSEGDLFLDGAEGEVEAPDCVFSPGDYYPGWTLEPANNALLDKVFANAGWQDVSLPPYSIPWINVMRR